MNRVTPGSDRSEAQQAKACLRVGMATDEKYPLDRRLAQKYLPMARDISRVLVTPQKTGIMGFETDEGGIEVLVTLTQVSKESLMEFYSRVLQFNQYSEISDRSFLYGVLSNRSNPGKIFDLFMRAFSGAIGPEGKMLLLLPRSNEPEKVREVIQSYGFGIVRENPEGSKGVEYLLIKRATPTYEEPRSMAKGYARTVGRG